MNFDIFKEEDKSGKMSKRSYLEKNYPDELSYIIDWSLKNKIQDIPLKEIIYLFINNKVTVPTCKNINCNKTTKFRNKTLGYRDYCSNKCISSDPNMIKHKEEKSLKKWGTKAPAQSKEVKDKIIKTNNERYGHNSPIMNMDVKRKSINTLKKNWGVTNPSKNKNILDKRVKSFKDNVESYKESYKKTSLERYGVEHPWSNVDVHQKTIDHFYKSYKTRINNKSKNTSAEFINFIKGDKTVLEFKCNDCSNNFDILTYQFYWRVNNDKKICTNCFPIDETPSLSESELYDFINNNYNGTIKRNIRNVIQPYELDVYLPDLNMAFEFNGVYWHSDKFKNKKYHLDKYNKCINNNIRLITIWEDDWNIKKDICKSFILNKLNKSEKIGARKCKIEYVNYTESKIFLENNHLQGDCKSSIRIALKYDNEIYSLMTFSKPRLPLGGKNTEGVYELTRFCNKINTTVIGGASRLLKKFISDIKPLETHSYSDNMISEGELYKKLGFEYSHTSEPSYWYVINKVRQHRFNWRKDKLVKMGYDSSKYEHEIMEELGHYRVWSCGNKKWIYKN